MAYSLIKQNLQVQFLNDHYKNGKQTKLFQHVKEGAEPSDLVDFASALSGLRHGSVGEVVVLQYQKAVGGSSDNN